MKYNFVDLFSGCGGLSEGFYKNKFKALTHVEIDKFSCETLKNRLVYHGYKDKDISILNKDITDENIIEKIDLEINGNIVDVLVGGPPCQSFSSLGKAQDKFGMREDPRNYLFESYEKILNHLKPKIFVFENVMGLLSARLGNRKTFEVIKEKLGVNYNLSSNNNDMILDACEYGVPQIRKRVILIGIRKDINYKIEKLFKNIVKTHYTPDTPSSERNGKIKFVTVKDAILDLSYLMPGQGNEKNLHDVNNWNNYLTKIRSKDEKHITHHVARNHNLDDRQRYREMSKNKWTFKELLSKIPNLNHKKQRVFNNSYVVQFWEKPARTIIAHLYKDGNQFIHPDFKLERTLTAREAARLQSFPDDFTFSGSRTQQFKQIGNAVPPMMADKIAASIKKLLKEI